MTKRILYCLLLTTIFNITLSNAQISKFSPEDFELSGSTVQLGDNCFRLTPNQDWTTGSLWNRTPIDLKHSFDMEIDVRLGCVDHDGADGIVFIFYPHSKRTGQAGEGIGFGGLNPSLGIEMDTWENDYLGDPWYDHIAIIANGKVAHYNNLTKPVPIKSDKGNIEDCAKHRLKVVWEATTKTLTVFFDGASKMSIQKDLVREIFNGNSNVFWGFTAATGGSSNIHEVCLEKLEIIKVESTELDDSVQESLLAGDCINLKNIEFESGKTVLKPDSKKELNKVVSFLKYNSKHKLSLYGHTDSVGSQAANKSISQKRADVIKDYLISKGIPKSRISAIGVGEKYPVSNNSTEQGKKENRRIEICVSKPRA